MDKKFIKFHGEKTHPGKLEKKEIESYLGYLNQGFKKQ
jgi:hypothetical protein